MLKKILISLICSVIFTACLNNKLSALEWQEPIRLTFTQGERMQVPYNACVDYSDNVYLLYHLEDAEMRRNNHQDVFLKINLTTGERIGPLYPFGENSIMPAFGRLVIDENGSAHIVSICEFPDVEIEYYYTRLSSNGDVEVEPTRLDGLWQQYFGWTGEFGDGHGPYLRLLPDGNLVWYARANRNPRNDSGFITTLTYTRITPEGQFVDSTRILHQEETEFAGPIIREQFTVDSNGNIYCTWNRNTVEDGGAHITIIDADDNIIVDNLRLRGEGGYDLVQDLFVADDGSIYMARQKGNPMQNRLETYGQKFDSQLNHQFYVEFGMLVRFASYTAIDYEDGRVAVFSSPVEAAPDGYAYGYIEFGDNGEVLDSLQFPPKPAHSPCPEVWLRSGAAYCFVLDDSLDMNPEIWMIKSEPVNGIKEKWAVSVPSEIGISLYPNPFNECLNLSYHLEKQQVVEIVIYDNCGRLIRRLGSGFQMPGQKELSLGSELATGSYFLDVNFRPGSEGAERRQTYRIVKIQ